MLPSGSSTPFVVIISPLFDTIHLHLCSLNDISMSLLYSLVVISELLIPGIQLDVIHIEEVADGYAISELVSIFTLDDLTGGVKASGVQRQG